MRYLLDTHAFLWLAHQSTSLSGQAREIMADSDNVLFLSLASIWELQIKAQIGRLELARPLVDIVREQQEVNQIQLLPIILEHIIALEDLPQHHQDPFDRMLIAQARHEDMPIITKDTKIAKYPVTILW